MWFKECAAFSSKHTHFQTRSTLGGFNEDNMEQSPSAPRRGVNEGGMKAGKRERVRGLENINRVFPGENSLIRGGEGVMWFAIQCSMFLILVYSLEKVFVQWSSKGVQWGYVNLNYSRNFFFTLSAPRVFGIKGCVCVHPLSWRHFKTKRKNRFCQVSGFAFTLLLLWF